MSARTISQFFWSVVVICLSLLNPVLAEDEKLSPPSLKANRLIGMTVENIDGEEIGKLQNFAVDLPLGKIKYVILAPNGIIAGRTRLRAVPPHLVSAATAKRNVIGFALTQAQWNQAPTFKTSEAATLGSAERHQQINAFYQKVSAEKHPLNDQSLRDAPLHLSPTGESHRQKSEIKLASELLGRNILSDNHEKLGAVLDLLLALDSKTPVLVVFSSGRLLSNRGHAYAVPLQSLTIQDGDLLVKANRKTLAAAPPLNQQTWEATHANTDLPQIFQYPVEH